MTSRLGVAIALVGAALLVTSSVGVSTVALERPVTIEVADDGEAMVQFNGAEVVAENETDAELVAVTNQAEPSLEADIKDFEGENATITDSDSVEIDRGNESAITASVTCEGSGTETVRLNVSATGDGITVERTVDATVDCGD